MIQRAYNYLAARLVRAIIAWCTPRKRYVTYVHRGRTYMRRYVIFGYRTGDPLQTGWRACLPNLYLHHMHAPDADTALHDHPWPWGLSFVLLGGYVEGRMQGADYTSACRVPRVRTHTAPALNYIPGGAFHRVAELQRVCYPCELDACDMFGPIARDGFGTFTLFLAGPRRRNKPWGYLVPGRGYVDQKIRHQELEATEVRP